MVTLIHTPFNSAFAFNEIAETVKFLSFTHDFHLHHNSSKCIEMVCKTIFYKSEVVRIVVMCTTQILNQSLQQTYLPTVSSKENAL